MTLQIAVQKIRAHKPPAPVDTSLLEGARLFTRENIHRPLTQLSSESYVDLQKAMVILQAGLGMADYKRFLKGLKKPVVDLR